MYHMISLPFCLSSLSSEKKAREIAAETGGAAIEIDVRDIRSVRKATNEFFAYYKKIDALVNNAGVALPIKTLLDCSEEACLTVRKKRCRVLSKARGV